MDSPWAYARRAHLRLILTVSISVALIVYLSIRLYTPPSCFDHKQNQDEVGVDCGGSCDLYCSSQVQAMSTVWARSFEVSPGWWSALAYIQNPNFDMQVKSAPYRFTLYDREGGLIVERTGVAFINREPVVPIFEGRINVGTREPYRTSFEWLEEPRWYKAPKAYTLTTEEQVLSTPRLGQDLEVTVVNKEPVSLSEVKVVAIVYDDKENAIATTETYLDRLGVREKRRVTFWWPEVFPATVGRIEFLPRVAPQE